MMRGMWKADVIKHFGSEYATAAALGLSRQAVNQWPEQVPELSSIKLERITKGVLVHDWDAYEREPFIEGGEGKKNPRTDGGGEQPKERKTKRS